MFFAIALDMEMSTTSKKSRVDVEGNERERERRSRAWTCVFYLASSLFCEPSFRLARLDERVRHFLYCWTI